MHDTESLYEPYQLAASKTTLHECKDEEGETTKLVTVCATTLYNEILMPIVSDCERDPASLVASCS